MDSYATVSEAVTGLLAKGYVKDFNLPANNENICWQLQGESLAPEEFKIDEIHRFEGETDPGDEMILYAISSSALNLKGILLSAYGMYGDHFSEEMVRQLTMGLLRHNE